MTSSISNHLPIFKLLILLGIWVMTYLNSNYRIFLSSLPLFHPPPSIVPSSITLFRITAFWHIRNAFWHVRNDTFTILSWSHFTNNEKTQKTATRGESTRGERKEEIVSKIETTFLSQMVVILWIRHIVSWRHK